VARAESLRGCVYWIDKKEGREDEKEV